MVGRRAVVLVFVLLGLEGVLIHASAQNCNASSDVELNEENVVAVYHEAIPSAKNMSATVFVQPGVSFEGVSVEVSFGTDKNTVWFPIDQCRHSGTTVDFTWVQLNVEVKVESHNTGYYLYYTLDFGGCVKKCHKHWNWSLDIIGSLKVMAHGSSKWKCSKPPLACLANNMMNTTTTTIPSCENPSLQLPANSPSATCNATSTLTTTSTPTSTATSTPTSTATSTPTSTATSTPTSTATSTPTSTATSTPASTATPTASLPPSAKNTDDKYCTPHVFSEKVAVTVAHILIVVDIVMMIVVLVALVPEMRKHTVESRRGPGPKPVPPTRTSHLSMNSLYESFSGLSQRHH